MSSVTILHRIWRDSRGAAAEFVIILPLALLLLLGVIDAGRYLYEVNKGEKATQIGARWAVATDVIAPELETESYVGTTVGSDTLTQGDRIPAAALGLISCDNNGCVCTTAPCPGGLTVDANSFDRLLARMQLIKGDIANTNLVVEYRGSGLGYAGDPNGMDISPLATVRLRDMTFPAAFLFGVELNLPSFSYTLPMEDGEGTSSN